MTVTCLVTVPAALFAVRVYVVVAAGLVVAVPEGGREPLPGAMVTDETPVTFQFSVELPPALMLVGLAVKVLITGNDGGGAAATATVTDSVTLPAALVALRV